MPRFVLLYHDCPPHYERPSHWDFLLEAGDSLRTWAIERLPSSWHEAQRLTIARMQSHCSPSADGDEVAADELGRHRREYLDYEGEVSNNRGRVVRIAEGTYETDSETAILWRVTLQGAVITGPAELQRDDERESRWKLKCVPGN